MTYNPNDHEVRAITATAKTLLKHCKDGEHGQAAKELRARLENIVKTVGVDRISQWVYDHCDHAIDELTAGKSSLM